MDISGSGQRQVRSCCEHSNNLSGSIKRKEFFKLDEQLQASQERLCCVQSVG